MASFSADDKLDHYDISEDLGHEVRGKCKEVSRVDYEYFHTTYKRWNHPSAHVADGNGKRYSPSTSPNLSCASQISTLEDSLKRFDLIGLFQQLERSLEEVKKNRKTKEQHEDLFKQAEKKMLKLSLKNHPDRVCSRGGSQQEVEEAHKLQSALNATKKVLKMLTAVFLKETDIDYKYGHFSKLNINLLVNEDEINHRIEEVLFKISELSEIKRLNIIGEIRKFLIESQMCLESYFKSEKEDFMEHRGNALYHLKKCIEGYEMLLTECRDLEKECIEENDEGMRSVIQKVSNQSLKECSILNSLENIAKENFKSLKKNRMVKYLETFTSGNFEIFVTDELIDDYFILPFVYYVNVISMCDLMLEGKQKSSWNLSYYSHQTVWFENENPLIARAYCLAYHLYDRKQFRNEVLKIMERHAYPQGPDELKLKLYETLQEVAIHLKDRFAVNAYKEGKSNRVQLNERLRNISETLTDFQEKERILREKINQYEKASEETWSKFDREMEERRAEAKDTLERCGSEQKSEGFSFSHSNFSQNALINRSMCGNNDKKSWNISEQDGESEMREVEDKQCAAEVKKMLGNEYKEIWRSRNQTVKVDNDEFPEKSKKRVKQSKNINEQISELEEMFNKAEKKTYHAKDKKPCTKDHEVKVQESSKSSKDVSKQIYELFSHLERNSTENITVLRNEVENSLQEKRAETKIQGSLKFSKHVSGQLSELRSLCERNTIENIKELSSRKEDNVGNHFLDNRAESKVEENNPERIKDVSEQLSELLSLYKRSRSENVTMFSGEKEDNLRNHFQEEQDEMEVEEKIQERLKSSKDVYERLSEIHKTMLKKCD